MSESTPVSNIHLFGIRHHGPGCARSLLRALHELRPDCVLIEGPPEGEEMLPLVLHEEMQAPVALLIYAPDDSRRAAFYPFAEFSPEWQALRYALSLNLPVRLIDLPVTHAMALEKEREQVIEAAAQEKIQETAQKEDQADAENTDQDTLPPSLEDESDDVMQQDPMDWFGRAAGYSDGETWWNHMVEERIDGLELFQAIREAMTTLRNEAPPPSPHAFAQRREMLREAHMRKCLRQAQKDGFERIAVVCGAWHVPALSHMPAAKEDNELLKGLSKLKVSATWVPWTYANLSRRSGYGAGVHAPAWYEHLWRSEDQRTRSIGWLARVARLLRDKDLDCSSAHIIETARLAESLAAMRERPQPGLDELCEALKTVVCMGEEAPLQLIHHELIVGHKMGAIPSSAPAVPLQRDLEQQQKSLRLKPDAAQKTLDLDLRQPNDLARSHLLHRLSLLNIKWGVLTRTGARGGGSAGAGKGTFHEVWTLQWEPQLFSDLIDASRWGSTVLAAATAYSIDQTQHATRLPVLADWVNKVLLADLPAAIGPVTQCLENLAATVGDTAQLLETLPPLAAIARYGNVRQTDTDMVSHVLQGLVPRAAIGLPGACASLNDEGAAHMRQHIVAAHAAIRLLDQDTLQDVWQHALRQLALRDGSVHGLLRGLACRLLFDEQRMPVEDISQHMGLALSTANEPAQAAAWIEGFLNQSSMVLLHDDALWALLDEWLSGLTQEHFVHVLPMLRRTFSEFSAPERRQLGERAKRPISTTSGSQTLAATPWDAARAALPLPLLRRLLGLAETTSI